MSACSTVQLQPLEPSALAKAAQADTALIRKDVEPLSGPLSLEEAMARALKYNLERRAKMMEETLALGQFDVSKYDMLPRLLASAGYSWRDNDKISLSRSAADGTLSPSQFISTDREHLTRGLDFTWSLLDLSLGYYGAKQQGDRALVAVERRHKAIQQVLLDTRTAFWRATAAQKLQDTVQKTIAVAEEALKDARSAEGQRLRSPIDSMRYQRQLLENMRLLEGIDAELGSAQVELAQLINAPLGQSIVLAAQPERDVSGVLLAQPMARLESLTLANNPDLREAHYNTRIAREEVRRTMAKLYPNVSLNWGVKYDSDSYMVNRDWQEAGLQVSFNLFNLFTGPTQIKAAEAGVSLADQRRLAMHVGVLTQMHLARLALSNARKQFDRADSIWAVDMKIANLVQNQQTAQSQSKLEAVSNATTATLSLLRRYQALAQVQAAENRFIASLGLEPQVGSVQELSVKQIVEQLGKQFNTLGEFFK
jgi:outer membrane protein TolC